MDRVLAGSESAARELVAKYGPAVLAEVRHRLSRQLRSKFDSQDFVQDVWASFFAHLPPEGTFLRPEELASFLTRLARHKVLDIVRQRLHGKKYNVHREEPLEDSLTGDEKSPVARQPTASALAISREEFDRLLQKQPPVYRRILLLLRDGKTPAEIAQEENVSERTVRRVMKKVLPGLLL